MSGAANPSRGPVRPGTVTVRFGDSTWNLAADEVVTIGRSRTCDIRLPDDTHLSRTAASIRPEGDHLLVRNLSATKPLILRPRVGEDTVVEPGCAVTSLPHREFAVLFAGQAGRTVEVQVDARLMAPPVVAAEGSRTGMPVTVTPDTVTVPMSLTAAQRRVLAALCEPLLTRHGVQAVPATYAQMAERLRLRPGYVRNVVKAVREGMSGHGVPGLTGEDTGPDGTSAHEDYRWALARTAVRNRWITAADVAMLGEQPAVAVDLAGQDETVR